MSQKKTSWPSETSVLYFGYDIILTYFKHCPLGGTSLGRIKTAQLSVWVITDWGGNTKSVFWKTFLHSPANKNVYLAWTSKDENVFSLQQHFSFLEYFSVLQLVFVIWSSSLMEIFIPSFLFNPWSFSTLVLSQVSSVSWSSW